VVAPEDEEVLRILDLVGQKEADGLERLLASVDVITEEEIVCFGREATILKETEQVVVLTMNVAADLDPEARYSAKRTCHTNVGQRRAKLTLIGASSSRRIGWEMKISRALVQRYLISASRS
jgi:hypothetical protein